MKKHRLKKVLFLLVMSITLIGCSEEENQTVIVTKSFWERAQKAANNGSVFDGDVFTFLKDNMEEYDNMFESYQSSFEEEYNNAAAILEKCTQRLDEAEAKVQSTNDFDLEIVQKTVSKYQPDAVKATKNGECGYVDLGLPSGTLWATSNLGIQQMEKANKNFNDYLTKPQRPEAPKLPENKNLKEYIIMKSADEVGGGFIEVPYKEFVAILEKTHFEAPSKDNIDKLLRRIKDELLNNIVDKARNFRDYQVFDYERDAYNYVEDYKKAYNRYNFDILSHDYSYLLDLGKPYTWGTNFVMDDTNGPTSFPASEDWATVLLGSKWATPTKEQVEELLQNCELNKINMDNIASGTIIYESNNQLSTGKIQGYELKSKLNGKTLFLPGDYKYMINERVNDKTYYVLNSTKKIEKVQDRNPMFYIRPIYKNK